MYNIQSSFQPIAQLPAPRQMNLQTPVNAVYPTKPLSELLHFDLAQNQVLLLLVLLENAQKHRILLMFTIAVPFCRLLRFTAMLQFGGSHLESHGGL